MPARSTHFANMLVSTVFTTGITSVFSLIYISQIFAFAPALVAPALTIVAVTVAFSVISSLVQMGISRRQMELDRKRKWNDIRYDHWCPENKAFRG